MRFEAITPRVTPDDPQLTALIDAERMRMLFAPAQQMVIMGSIVAVLLALVVGHEVGLPRALTWAGLCIMSGAARMVHSRAYHRSQDRMNPRWLRQMTWLAFANGLSWGLAAVFIMPIHDLVTSAVVVSTLVGAAAISTFTLQSSMAPNLAMNVPLMLPACLMLASRLDTFGLFGSAGVFTLSIFMLLESRRAERRISELLWLRFTTDRISVERAEALKLAQRHAAIKDQFLATMSHEMRTPLHGILGLSQLIQQRLPARVGPLADARQHAALIQRSGDHLLTLINDVLDFSRIEAGRLHVDSAPFDLRALLDDVLALSRVTASAKGLALVDEIELPRPCWALGDAARVRQVLFNMLGNAIKFTEQGRVLLRAARRECEDGSPNGPHGESPCSRRVQFDVEDTGIGIPPEMIDKVFDAFQQADNSFGRRHQGTGLGLTISREIARAMGGDLMCRSQPGEGSVFWLTTPLPPCEAPKAPGNATTAANTAQSSSTGTGTDDAEDSSSALDTVPNEAAWLAVQGLNADDLDTIMPPGMDTAPLIGHVLLVEDNPVNALVADAAMAQMGLQVTLATDGQQALELLTVGPHRFDVVLMDCQMPVLDGIEATRRLRAHEQDAGLPNVPVVALTANAMPQDRQRCTAAGMDDHLAKPFKHEELAAVLRRHLAPRKVTA
jgi:signal transduction histidine kinase/ActR/RegA family two-component response regulator